MLFALYTRPLRRALVIHAILYALLFVAKRQDPRHGVVQGISVTLT